MKKIPRNVNKIIDKFTNRVNEILGDRIKKLYFMAHMQGEILIRIQI